MIFSLILTFSLLNLHYKRVAFSSCNRPTIFSAFSSGNHSIGIQETPIIAFKSSTKLKEPSLRCIIYSFPSRGLFSKIEGLFISQKLTNVDAFIYQYASNSVKNEYGNAITNLAKIFANAFYERAIVLIDQGDLDRAIECLNNAINFRADVAEYFFTKAKVYLDKKEYALTIEDCTKAIELNPNCVVDYYFYRGIAYKNIGDNDKAIADLSFVIKLDANNVEAYKQRSCIYAEIGNDDLAIRDFTQELKHLFQ
jgi:tetratricopeptide (TPR) repeat protein